MLEKDRRRVGDHVEPNRIEGGMSLAACSDYSVFADCRRKKDKWHGD